MKKKLFKFNAKIRVLKTEEGGRKTPFFSGYRPNICFHEGSSDSGLYFDDRNQIYPGEEADVTLYLLHPEWVTEYLSVNQHFTIHEGPKKVGTGMITEIEEDSLKMLEELKSEK